MTDDGLDTAVRVERYRRRAEELALVLLAEGLASKVERVDAAFSVVVSSRDVERALQVLAEYESEGALRTEPEVEEPLSTGALNAALATSAALLVFFLGVTGPRDTGGIWFERGSADAALILSGEWWRTVTALTLHADLPHVISNMLAGTLFLTALGGTRGAGLASLLVLIAGASGNLANAMYYGSLHRSVGASTAVFGAVGILGGQSVIRRQRGGTRGHRVVAPLAASLALLAMLGAGARSGRVDVWAHAFGLLAGMGIGLATGVWVRGRPGTAVQWGLAALAVGIVVYCWAVAVGV